MWLDPDATWAALSEKLLRDARKYPLQLRAFALIQHLLRQLDSLRDSVATDDETRACRS